MAATPVIDALNVLLADSTVFYQKLRHYHWNVQGPHFFELHAKFEELYDRWALTVDEVAERILMLNGTPLHTLKALLAAATLDEDEQAPAATEMVHAIEADLRAIHTSTGELIVLAEDAADRGTVNQLDALRDAIEKDLWMLRAWQAEHTRSWS
jgi:starvation-inducible DNA-binding protein